MMDSPEMMRRLEGLEVQVKQINQRLEELGVEVGTLAGIMLEAGRPAEGVTEEKLDEVLKEIFQGAESLPLDEALRRAIALKERL